MIALSACSPVELKEGDRDLVLKIGQLKPFGLNIPQGFEAHERFHRQESTNGSQAVLYEFFDPSGSPFLSSTAETHPSNEDACESVSTAHLDISAGLDEENVSLRDDLYRFGDQSRFGLLMAEGQPFGNYFAMCQGNTSFKVILGGFFFTNGNRWGDLIEPTLNAVVAME